MTFKRQDWTATDAANAFGPERYDPSWNLPVATRGDGLYWLQGEMGHHYDRYDIGVIDDHENWILEHLLIPPGGVMFDIGAHVGCFGIWNALRGAKVYAFEPHPRHFSLLEKNIRLNAVQDNFKTFNCALGSKSELIYLKDQGTASCIESDGTLPALVEVCDDLLWQQPEKFPEGRIDIVKIDVEGYEFEVVKGMTKLILDYRPKFVIEVHSHYAQYAANGTLLHDFFTNLGYKYRIIMKNTDSYHYIEAIHPEQPGR